MPKDYFKLANSGSLNGLPKGAHVHFVGVAGVGMAPLAIALKKLGYVVSGSDREFYEPMGSFLQNSGIDCRHGYSADNLKDTPDLVVIGNAISYSNPEVSEVEQQGLAYTSFPRLIAEAVIADRHSIVVCGTHGKSTTTALAASVLFAMNQNPSFFVGAMPLAFDSGIQIAHGKFSVVEGDEYDSAFFAKLPKFKFYNPKTCILTSVEFDHADIYPNLDSILKEFDDLVGMIPEDGRLICCLDCPNIRQRLPVWRSSCKGEILTYGVAIDADVVLLSSTQSGKVQDLQIGYKGGSEKKFSVPLFGLHNGLNAVAVFSALIELNFSEQEIAAGMSTFRGIKRRQEVLLEKAQLLLVEDFAHHPTAVRETIAAMKRAYPNHEIWAVFEPRTNTSRRKTFQNDYVAAFLQADRVYLCDVAALSIDKGHELLSVVELADQITQLGVTASCLPSPQEIKNLVVSEARKSDKSKLILVMSNGSFGGVPEFLRQQLES